MIPPTFTEETKESFERDFSYTLSDGSPSHRIHPDKDREFVVERILDFIHSRTQAAYDLGRAETLKEVREWAEENKLFFSQATHGTTDSSHYARGVVSILSDLILDCLPLPA